MSERAWFALLAVSQSKDWTLSGLPSVTGSVLLRIKRYRLRWFGHVVRIPPDVSLMRCFSHVHSRGDPEADPDHAGEILVWHGKALASSQSNWWKWPGKGQFGLPYLKCYPLDPDPDKQVKRKLYKLHLFIVISLKTLFIYYLPSPKDNSTTRLVLYCVKHPWFEHLWFREFLCLPTSIKEFERKGQDWTVAKQQNNWNN